MAGCCALGDQPSASLQKPSNLQLRFRKGAAAANGRGPRGCGQTGAGFMRRRFAPPRLKPFLLSKRKGFAKRNDRYARRVKAANLALRHSSLAKGSSSARPPQGHPPRNSPYRLVSARRTASVTRKKRGTPVATRQSRIRFFCWSERPTCRKPIAGRGLGIAVYRQCH